VRATKVVLPIYVGSIPTEELDGFNSKLKTSLQRVVKEGIDMERMSMVINRDERQVNIHQASDLCDWVLTKNSTAPKQT